jgi:hypothetical protein
MGEVVEILKAIMNKLEMIDERLSRIEEELFEEISDEELREIEEIIEACESGKMKVYTLEEAKKELGI